jgi:hypothetical protein
MPKGSKRPRGFLISHQKGESKPMLKGAKKPRGVLVNHLEKGDQNLCQISAAMPGKLVQQEKQKFTISRGNVLSTRIKLV